MLSFSLHVVRTPAAFLWLHMLSHTHSQLELELEVKPCIYLLNEFAPRLNAIWNVNHGHPRGFSWHTVNTDKSKHWNALQILTMSNVGNIYADHIHLYYCVCLVGADIAMEGQLDSLPMGTRADTINGLVKKWMLNISAFTSNYDYL